MDSMDSVFSEDTVGGLVRGEFRLHGGIMCVCVCGKHSGGGRPGFAW